MALPAFQDMIVSLSKQDIKDGWRIYPSEADLVQKARAVISDELDGGSVEVAKWVIGAIIAEPE